MATRFVRSATLGDGAFEWHARMLASVQAGDEPRTIHEDGAIIGWAATGAPRAIVRTGPTKVAAWVDERRALLEHPAAFERELRAIDEDAPTWTVKASGGDPIVVLPCKTMFYTDGHGWSSSRLYALADGALLEETHPRVRWLAMGRFGKVRCVQQEILGEVVESWTAPDGYPEERLAPSNWIFRLEIEGRTALSYETARGDVLPTHVRIADDDSSITMNIGERVVALSLPDLAPTATPIPMPASVRPPAPRRRYTLADVAAPREERTITPPDDRGDRANSIVAVGGDIALVVDRSVRRPHLMTDTSRWLPESRQLRVFAIDQPEPRLLRILSERSWQERLEEDPFVAISRDGRVGAEGGRRESLLRVWDLASGELLQQIDFAPDDDTIADVAFADGHRFHVATTRGRVFGYEPTDVLPQRAFVASVPEAVVALPSFGTIERWLGETFDIEGSPIVLRHFSSELPRGLWALPASPDGDTLALTRVASMFHLGPSWKNWMRGVVLVDRRTLGNVRVLMDEWEIRAIAFGGELVATVGGIPHPDPVPPHRGNVVLWRLADGARVRELPFTHDFPVGVAFEDDGAIVVEGQAGSLRRFAWPSGEANDVEPTPERLARLARSRADVKTREPTPNDDVLVESGDSGALTLVSGASRRVLAPPFGLAFGLEVTRDGENLLVRDRGAWRLATGERVEAPWPSPSPDEEAARAWLTIPGEDWRNASFDLDPARRVLAVARADGRGSGLECFVHVALYTYPGEVREPLWRVKIDIGARANIRLAGVTIDPRGEWLVVAYVGQRVHVDVLSIATGETLGHVRCLADVSALTFSPDGSVLYVAHDADAIAVVRLRDPIEKT